MRLPVYLLLVIEGSGFIKIVGLFLIEEEFKEVINFVVNKFKEWNEAWPKAKVVMSDKDFIEYTRFSACIAEAELWIFLYHAHCSFRRKITHDKMGITSAERNRALEIIQSIAFSISQALFRENVKLYITLS